jgi:hypothetical protein
MKNDRYLCKRGLKSSGFAIVFAVLAACASDNELSGSLDQVYRLQFDLVRARMYSSALSIEYVAVKSGVVRVRLTIDLKTLREENKKLKSGESYNLAKYGDITGRQADGTEIFRFTSGKLTLDEFDKRQDAEIRGSFDAKFRAGDDVFALSGNFFSELDLVPEPNLG